MKSVLIYFMYSTTIVLLVDTTNCDKVFRYVADRLYNVYFQDFQVTQKNLGRANEVNIRYWNAVFCKHTYIFFLIGIVYYDSISYQLLR